MKDTPAGAAKYDFFMRGLDMLLAKKWRRKLWNRVEGPAVLEAGAGTGLNIPYYRTEFKVTALDNNRNYLDRARHRAVRYDLKINFIIGNIQKLPFRAESFDTAVTTFLFCQLHKPLQGLQELYRVLKQGGQLLLLEHVRTQGLFGQLFTTVAEPLYRLTGDHIARDTESFVAKAGFVDVNSTPVFTNAVRIIQARK